MADFYDVGPVRKLANNLFNGWGYNFYRLENQLRADDQLVRAKTAWLLGQAVASIAAAEADYRRAFPPPTRANPFPDAALIANAHALERMGAAIGALKARVDAQPVPANDRMTQFYRKEAPTLLALIEKDEILIGQAELLRAGVDGHDAAWLLANRATVDTGVAALSATLRERAGLIHFAG